MSMEGLALSRIDNSAVRITLERVHALVEADFAKTSLKELVDGTVVASLATYDGKNKYTFAVDFQGKPIYLQQS